MTNLSNVIQVSSVKPGSFGGAIFSGRIIGENKIYTCKASYKIITRAPQSGECWQFKGSIVGHDQFRDFVVVESCHIVNLPIAAYVERLLIKTPGIPRALFWQGQGFEADKRAWSRELGTNPNCRESQSFSRSDQSRPCSKNRRCLGDPAE